MSLFRACANATASEPNWTAICGSWSTTITHSILPVWVSPWRTAARNANYDLPLSQGDAREVLRQVRYPENDPDRRQHGAGNLFVAGLYTVRHLPAVRGRFR